jgi:hypothetical protein
MLDPSELKVGSKGYGLTVFSGTQPERFDVEVIGVLKNFLPNQDLILIKTPHPRLEAAKVVAGMSGSPIFVDGKMIGAYAYGWQFGSEPVAGVTPIRSMLNELSRPIPPELLAPLPTTPSAPAHRRAATASSDLTRFAGNSADYDVLNHARQIGTHLSGAVGSLASSTSPVPVATPLMIGGMRETSLQMLRDVLSPLGMEPLQAGGGSSTPDADAPTRFVDGGAIGVQLVRGDISATGIGTVTRVSGDRLVAFGHPMMNTGVSRLPTAIAKIHWVLASTMRSFKIGVPVRPMGSLINDRQAAIVVDSKVDPPMFPVHLEINGVEGAPHPVWNMEVAHEKFMAPTFVAVALGNAVDATTQEKRDLSWHAYTKIRVRGYGDFTMHDFGVSVGGNPDASTFMRSRAVRAVGALLNNPWEDVDILGVETKLDVRFARDLLSLRGVEPLETEVTAGERAHLRLHLVPFAGPEQIRVVEVPIPQHMAGQTIEIKIAPGYEENNDLARPENVRDLIANLPQLTLPPDVLVASIETGAQGMAFRGQVAPDLPLGALDTLRSSSSSAAPEPFVSTARTVIPMHQFITGKDTVHIHVRNVIR